uniref:Uncharacterized protein n=1 Tax=Rhizophora mucronata TaxID=61149 RepID=A0A2P2IJC3_RHIMU
MLGTHPSQIGRKLLVCLPVTLIPASI